MLKDEMSGIGPLVKNNLGNGSFKVEDPDQYDLVKAIERKMEELGFNATQLALTIGFSKSKVSEILNRKRPLSKKMAKALYSLGIPAEELFMALISD